MIQQLGEMAARVAGLVARRKFEDALAVVRQSEQELLGPLIATLHAVDAPTVRLLLGSDEKVGIWAVLLTERASVLCARGDHDAARLDAQRALELFQLLEASGYRNPDVLGARGAAERLSALRP